MNSLNIIKIKTLNELHKLTKETEQDVPGYDVDKWETKHKKSFYLRNIPSEILRDEIFTYLNCSWNEHGDILSEYEWCKAFRATCKEFANAISIKDCISVLSITSPELDVALLLKEKHIAEIESLRCLTSLKLWGPSFKRERYSKNRIFKVFDVFKCT